MSDTKNLLFPLILDILSHKPQLCETQQELLKEINQQLGGGRSPNKDLKKQLESTIDVGKSLGILSVRDEDVRMPFSLRSSRPTTSARTSNKREKARSNIRSRSSSRSRSHSHGRSTSRKKSGPKQTKKTRK